MNKLKIIIPVYRATLKPEEEGAMDNNIRMLRRWTVVLLKPKDLDISWMEKKYPQAEVVEVSDEWLGTKRGVAGYNAMMMSADFYRIFSDCEFILICQTDAWIFRDEMDKWISRPFDHVAAPWVTWPVFSYFPFSTFTALRRRLTSPSKMLNSDLYGHVGNGGLSLRRVASFISACENHAKTVDEFLKKPMALHNEDVFFALVATELRVPTAKEAVTFSIDVKPTVCYRKLGKRLPMGCHGYRQRSRWGFWKRFIKDC